MSGRDLLPAVGDACGPSVGCAFWDAVSTHPARADHRLFRGRDNTDSVRMRRRVAGVQRRFGAAFARVTTRHSVSSAHGRACELRVLTGGALLPPGGQRSFLHAGALWFGSGTHPRREAQEIAGFRASWRVWNRQRAPGGCGLSRVVAAECALEQRRDPLRVREPADVLVGSEAGDHDRVGLGVLEDAFACVPGPDA